MESSNGAIQERDHDDDVEVKFLNPQNNVPDTDQRSHTVLVNETFIEYLARCPPGLQSDVSAVMISIKGWMDEIVRLKKMEKMKPDQRGNVRVLKDTTTYFIRRLKPCIKHDCDGTKQDCAHVPAKHPQRKKQGTWQRLFAKPSPPEPELEEGIHYTIEEKRIGIYTVLPAVQIPHYRRKFERQTAQAIDWVYRMMRLWIGEDGKGRIDMIDALQASNGKLQPAEAGKMPMINIMNGSEPKPGGWVKNR